MTEHLPTEPARAKLNLYLHVLGRRPDGYHELDSLVVFAGAADRLSVDPDGDGTGLTLALTGPFASGLAGEADNLVLRAARALARAAGRPAAAGLRLEKNLPVASGIGGGSADAAATLRLLARHWGTDLPDPVMQRLAAELGADVPVCLASRPARMGGLGERLEPAPDLPPCGLLLVNPGVALATAAVFRTRTGPWSAPAALPRGWASATALAADLARLRNDLEAPAIALCPVIAEVLAALRAQPGCLHAAMSGSGATCYGLFASEAAAASARLPAAWWRHPA